jgi:hypothetical protein
MSARSLVVPLVLFLVAASLAHAGERSWRSAKIVDIKSQVMGLGQERRLYHVDIEGDKYIYIAIDQLMWRKRFAKVTVNATVRAAVEGESIFVIDEDNREIKLKLFSKIVKSEADAVVEKAPSPSESAAPVSGGEIRRGMATAEVEKILGKPVRTVVFERRTQWMYQKLVVLFEDDRVTDIQF